MELRVTEDRNVVVLEVEGSIMGGPDAAQLSDEIHQKLLKDRKNFVVNLNAIDLINSTGLGILISNLTHVKNAGGDLRLCHTSDKIKQILHITKLSSVFQQFATVDEAVQSFV